MLERLYWSAYLAYHLRGQAQYPFRPPAVIQRDQARRVRQMSAYAYRHVPYYRETMDQLGLRPSDFKSADDLARLPLLERDQIQRDPEYFVSKAQPLDRYLRLRSGGSTGAPCTIYHDVCALFQNRAHSERERTILARLIGKPWGYHQVAILLPLSSSHKIGGFLHARSLTPPGLGIQRHTLSLFDPPEKNVQRINALKPDILHSFGSYLEILYAHLQTTREPFHRPRVITYTSDGLSDSIRRVIEHVFHIPVFSIYQAIEALRIGSECEQHRGLHLNSDLYPLLPGPCPCGRSLPLLSFPQGRNDDLIWLPGERIMHPQAIRVIFIDETQVWQYQVVQQAETHFRVAIVAAEACDRPQTSARVVERFTRTFGPSITVDIVFVDSIPRMATGKVRPVLSLHQQCVLAGQHGNE